jgi:NAD-dependent SIR2 family protein deacetylase
MGCRYENSRGECVLGGRRIPRDAVCQGELKTFICIECGYEFDEEVVNDEWEDIECPKCGSTDIDPL